jgi:hypothetical protein
MIRSLTILSVAALQVAAAQAQPVVRELTAPAAELPTPFSGIRGLRELRDGRVIVNDYIERFVKLVDMQARTVITLGRHGNGPGEYQLPLNLIALPGDSAGLYDMGREGRLFVVTATGVTTVVIPPAGQQQQASLLSEGTQSDATGRLYVETFPRSGDSSVIVRLNRTNGRIDSLARVSRRAISPRHPNAATATRATSAGAGAPGRAVTMLPFTTHDQWAVALDGRVAVVSVYPYRVTFAETDGRRWAAPEIPFEPVRLADAHKEIWRDMESAPVATLSSSGGGGLSASMRARTYEAPAAWPEFMPPFYDNAVSFAPDGNLWVQRIVPANSKGSVDVIDRAGRVAGRVIIPSGSRVAGFGGSSVYLVRRDANGLEYLQRYPLPRH